jgi:Arc/MetJ-type ribon-helix-helix transcriptional regulator
MSVKATFAIDDLVLHEAREFVRENSFKSLSAFVERAIREELARMRQGKIRSALLSAANDPLFMADVMDIQQAFEHADYEKTAP